MFIKDPVLGIIVNQDNQIPVFVELRVNRIFVLLLQYELLEKIPVRHTCFKTYSTGWQ